MPIKVLVVDDSALIRSLLSEIVKAEPDMQLVGAAPDAFVARDMVRELQPDVITLDIEMPKVDGLTFLDRLMKAQPTPVIMISTLTEERADATLRALELGAVDFMAKPKVGVVSGIEHYRQLIVEKIRAASFARVTRRRTVAQGTTAARLMLNSTEKIIAIGASTGGTEAIKNVLLQLPANAPGTVITQHMPPGFTRSYAKRLDALCALNVREAQGGERLLPGYAYLAPGDQHLLIERSGADYCLRLNDGPLCSGHKPSVDVMFDSLADSAGSNVVAALLTGMGKDGAQGMQALKRRGAYTLAQDEASCIVFGMPREAIRLGVVDEVLDLDAMGVRIVEILQKSGAGSRL